MSLLPEIWESPDVIEGIYDTAFLGLFAGSFTITLLIKAFYGLFILSTLVLFGIARRKGSSRLLKWTTFTSFSAFVCGWFLFSSPWDEIFVHLSHSRNLAEMGIFSFSRKVPIEGIVDFLPFIVIGLLAKLGLPLFEMAIFQSLLGGVLCLAVVPRFIKNFGGDSFQQKIGLFFATFFAPLLFNSGSGFGNALFAAAIVWSVELLYFSKRIWPGIFVLSLIPLIRWEGWGLALGLLFLLNFLRFRKHVPVTTKQNAALEVLCGALPFLLATLYRYFQFGAWVPVPVQQKQGIGDISFFWLGMRKLVEESNGSAIFFLLPLILFCMRLSKTKSQNLTAGLSLGLIFSFCFVYYMPGGDWFPIEWGRYLLPFTILTLAISLAFAVAHLNTVEKKIQWATQALVVFALLQIIPGSLAQGYLGRIRSSIAGRGDIRVQQLSQLGNHLGHTLTKDAVIGSSEIATVMFFANREALDYIGIVNPEVASAPIQRSLSTSYRRRRPEMTEKYMPNVIFPNGWLTPFASQEKVAGILGAWEEWVGQYVHDHDFRFNGLSHLMTLGYRPVIIRYKNNILAGYFLSPAEYDIHKSALRTAGFHTVKIPDTYQIPKSISDVLTKFELYL